MTTSTVTLVGDVSDLIGNDYDPSRTKVWVQHNTDKVVTDSGPIRLGAATQNVGSDGTFSFANVVASTSLVENLQATLWVDWPNTAGPERTRRQVSLGPYDLTGLSGTVDIRTLEATQALDPVASSALLSEMQDLRDQVQDISQIAVPDDVITAIDANPASDFRQQQDARQSASYATGGELRSKAKVDGSDQTPVINAEIAALQAYGGGRLILPTGDITIAGTILPRSSVIILGQGPVYREPDGQTGTTLLYTGTGTAFGGYNLVNAGLRDLTIRAANPSGTNMVGILYAGVWYLDVNNVSVIGFDEGHGYAFKMTANGDFGAYKNRITLLDAFAGVVRFEGTDAATLVTTTTLDTCWAARFEADDAMITWINCTPEGWAASYATGKGGFTFDKYGHHLLVHANMEHAPGNYAGIVVKPTFTGKGVLEIATAWQGFAADIRYVGTLGSLANGGDTATNSPRKSQWSPMVAGTKYVAEFWGQMEPAGNPDIVVWSLRSRDLAGGSQRGAPVLDRRHGNGVLVESYDFEGKYVLQNTKTLPADGNYVTFFTIPFNQGGWGAKLAAVATGVHAGNGNVASARDAIVGGDPGVVQKAQDNAGVSSCDIQYVASGGSVLVQARLQAVGGASSITLTLEALGNLRFGITKN